ncbi:MAG: hypothetical protein NTY75_03670 [Candidatus Shapirobacteria bacterium]|nr:hypothetical protein [Candidatus Shapirobacteria bacterium]
MTIKQGLTPDDLKKAEELLKKIEAYEPKNKSFALINELSKSEVKESLSEDNDDKLKHPDGRDIIYVITKKKPRRHG